MPALFLTCGLPGTGKSTWARAAELCGVTRLSVDDVLFDRNVARAKSDVYGGDEFRATRRGIEADLLTLAGARLLAGDDVVYDEGLWTRARRDAARAVAKNCDATAWLLHFVVDPVVQRRRIDARNRDLDRRQSTLTQDRLHAASGWFEPLSDEHHIVIDTTDGLCVVVG